MSVVQECARAEAVIRRARSLFATAATAKRTGDNSGVLIARHKTFANSNAVTLSGAGHTDAAIGTHVAHAATVTQTGAQRLDSIAAQTRATAQAAPTARTPAAQRRLLRHHAVTNREATDPGWFRMRGR